eukprot:4916825-Pyramimonas_sp.AAC.1
MSPSAIAREGLALHKLLRLPPNSFSLADLLSASWIGSSPRSLIALGLASAWRMASFTVSDWRDAYEALQQAADAACGTPALSAQRWASGAWCAPCWRRAESIV